MSQPRIIIVLITTQLPRDLRKASYPVEKLQTLLIKTKNISFIMTAFYAIKVKVKVEEVKSRNLLAAI